MENVIEAPKKTKVEDYRQGLLKRFDQLHMRCLLEQQDRLLELEKQLNENDDAENVQLNLSSRRQDHNQSRRALIGEIRAELQDYGKAILQYESLLALPQPSTKHRESVMNWVDGNKPLVRSESDVFLEDMHEDDFMTLKTGDAERGGLHSLLESGLRAFPTLAHSIRSSEVKSKATRSINALTLLQGKTDDLQIVLFSPRLLKLIVKCVVTIFIPVWVLLPAIMLYNSSSERDRLLIYSLFTLGTSFVLAFVASPTKYNLIISTYGAVLGAFLQGRPSTATR